MKCKMDIGIILFVFGIKLNVKLFMIIKWYLKFIIDG